jgi:hypothetical protein
MGPDANGCRPLPRPGKEGLRAGYAATFGSLLSTKSQPSIYSIIISIGYRRWLYQLEV